VWKKAISAHFIVGSTFKWELWNEKMSKSAHLPIHSTVDTVA